MPLSYERTDAVEQAVRDEVSITLAHAHCGFGAGSCDPVTIEPYCVDPGPIEFAVELRPFTRD